MALTARQVWEGMLTELSKTSAPSLLLHEFNYYFNKAINQYVNKRYNIYDVSQQTTDDLRVLKATAILDVTPIYDPRLKSIQSYGSLIDIAKYGAGSSKLFGATYEVLLPDDYLHMLNCTCIYEMLKSHRCYNKGDYIDFPAKRLTADAWSVIMNDYYNRPLPEHPYYYIHNVNSAVTNPTNWNNGNNLGTDYLSPVSTTYEDGSTGIGVEMSHPRVVQLQLGSNQPIESSIVERDAGVRYGNASKIRCEIRYGRDSSVYKLDKVLIDYIKAPQTIRLTKEQVDLTEDTSQIMEFPDYVCQEIINELTTLVMQRDADPRLQTQTVVTQSIANPAQQQTPQPQPQQRGN